MEQLRQIDTPAGPLRYTLVKKRVKNFNLKIKRDLSVVLSVPLSCPDQRADAFVREKGTWIAKARERLRETRIERLPPPPPDGICGELLQQAVDRTYPLVAPLGVSRPKLKLRKMRSQWGNCHWVQGYITLNTALGRCPEGLRDYVALHELVHFLHHDHGPGFYAEMDRLMPDWRARRKELRRWGGTLESG